MSTSIELSEILGSISPDNILRIIVSNKRNSIAKFNKVVVRRVSVAGEEVLQLESFTDKQCFHENIDKGELTARLEQLLTEDFRQLDCDLTDKTLSLKISKKGKLLVSQKKKSAEMPKLISLEHNRTKNYIIPEGMYVPALCDLGVITAEGKVVNRMYDKFKQINRFAELLHDAVKNDKRECFNIIDFGCGKSYLTFVIYHYFTAILKKRVHMVGLDLKEDVIELCNRSAKKYGYDDLHFFCGDIKDYNADFKPDIVISLHACDNATDYALYNSVIWQADYIFSVPCCQHEVNASIKADKLAIMCEYGIIKERLSALVTDTVRAKLLEYSGYKAELLEFIDIAHSPKNLLIRATKKHISNEQKKEIASEILKLKQELCFDQTLFNLIFKQNTEV